MRLIPPAVAAAVFAALALLYARRPELYEAVLAAWAVPVGEVPFIDWHAVLSAIQCHRLGEDVYAVNSCDLIGRMHAYSPLWLALPLPAQVGHTMTWGLGLFAAFLVALAALPSPRTAGGVAALLAAVLSPSVVLAVERANNDVVVLLAAVLAGRLLTRGVAARLAAYGLLILAALLKYYPAVALAVAARERPRLFLAIAAAGLAAAAAMVAAFWDRWEGAARLLALNLRFGLYTFSLRNPIEYAAVGNPALHDQPTYGLSLLALVLAFGLVVWGWHRRLSREGLRLRLDDPAEALLAVSGLLVAGCFITGSSLPYRAVLLLPALPALLRWADEGRRTATAMAALLLYLLWLPLLHHWTAPSPVAALLIAGKEVGWWLLSGVFAALVVPLATSLRSPPP